MHLVGGLDALAAAACLPIPALGVSPPPPGRSVGRGELRRPCGAEHHGVLTICMERGCEIGMRGAEAREGGLLMAGGVGWRTVGGWSSARLHDRVLGARGECGWSWSDTLYVSQGTVTHSRRGVGPGAWKAGALEFQPAAYPPPRETHSVVQDARRHRHRQSWPQPGRI